MQILIVNAYTRENKGDAALVSVLGKQLQSAFPSAHILVAGMEDPRRRPDFFGLENTGSMRLYASKAETGKSVRLMRKFFACAIALIWPSLPFRNFFARFFPVGIKNELTAITRSDLIVSASGGYLTGKDSFDANFYIYQALLPLRVARRFGKPIMFAPISLGPFGNDWQRRAVAKTINESVLTLVREDRSYELARSLGVRDGIVVRAIDSGFAHDARPNGKEHHDFPDGMRVGITARNWLPYEQQARYESALASFIIDLERSYHATAVLVPQVTSYHDADDDRIVETRIKELAMAAGGNPIQITDEMDHYAIKNLYSTFTFTVGTRFHSVIFSLTSYVPAIAIEYEYKTSGIMHDLGLDEWVIKMEEVTEERLCALFAELVMQRDAYRNHLMAVLPSYIKKADEVPVLIQQRCEQYVRDENKQ